MGDAKQRVDNSRFVFIGWTTFDYKYREPGVSIMKASSYY